MRPEEKQPEEKKEVNPMLIEGQIHQVVKTMYKDAITGNWVTVQREVMPVNITTEALLEEYEKQKTKLQEDTAKKIAEIDDMIKKVKALTGGQKDSSS